MPVNDNGVFVPASAMGPLDAAPRRPYDPPAPSSAAAQAARKAECDRIERAARERNARQCAAESAFMPAHSAAAPRMLPPEDYKEVDPQSPSQIVSAVMAFRPQRRVCHPRDGTHLGTESEVRNQIEARERGNFLLNLGGHDPLADEVERRVVEKLKAAGVEMAPEEVDETPNREAALQADVDYQLSCLIRVSAEEIEADRRLPERWTWSPGRPIKPKIDAQLKPLPELPTLTCPGCGEQNIKIDESVPPQADCLTPGCRRLFPVCKQTDEYGRSWYEASKPATHSADVFVIGGDAGMQHLGRIS